MKMSKLNTNVLTNVVFLVLGFILGKFLNVKESMLNKDNDPRDDKGMVIVLVFLLVIVVLAVAVANM